MIPKTEYDNEVDSKIIETLTSNSSYIIELEKELQRLLPIETEFYNKSLKLDELYECNEELMTNLENTHAEIRNMSKSIKSLTESANAQDKYIVEIDHEKYNLEQEFRERYNLLQKE